MEGKIRSACPFPSSVAAAAGPEAGPPKATVSWKAVAADELFPALVELTSRGDGRRFPLAQPENWAGADPAGASPPHREGEHGNYRTRHPRGKGPA